MASTADIFNHVVLPPCVPGTREENADNIARHLTSRLIASCGVLRTATGDMFCRGWDQVETLLKTSLEVNREAVGKKKYEEAFTQCCLDGQVLALYIAEQNAGLLVHSQTPPTGNSVVVFEAFEASPQSHDVLAAPNALRWSFPSCAAQIPYATFKEPDFQSSLATFLNKADAERLADVSATIFKAGVTVSEIRNHSHPALVTHMLLSILEAMGAKATVLPLKKRIRDDVNLEGGDIPWRRHPMWLVLRVAVQRQLILALGHNVGYVAYKLLISSLLANLVQSCVGSKMHPSLVVLLQKKLGRRLAKVEMRLNDLRVSDAERTAIQTLLTNSYDHGMFRKAISLASSYVNDRLTDFKKETTRRIPLLPSRVQNDQIVLSLPSSSTYLSHVVARQTARFPLTLNEGFNPEDLDLAQEGGIRRTLAFAKNALDELRQVEEAAGHGQPLARLLTTTNTKPDSIEMCRSTHQRIVELVALAASTPATDTGHAGVVCLSIFELWAKMDATAVSTHQMLAEYAPIFSPDLLNVLQLPLMRDMARLRRIQRYLQDRAANSKFGTKTIFDKLDYDCFGTRFARTTDNLCQLYTDITKKQEQKRQKKNEEWKTACDVYDRLSEEIEVLSCSCTIGPDGEWDVTGCNRCFTWRKRKRMTISVCEDLLPNDVSLAYAVVFELQVPECIAIYRTTTWLIITTLAYPSLPSPMVQKSKLLKESKNLKTFARFLDKFDAVSLASPIKSFEQTHYREINMKVDFSALIVPLGSDFQLFSATSRCWIADFKMPLTLAHRCGLRAPDFLKHVLPSLYHPPTYSDWPSSYSAIANRPECPSDLSIHEFEAVQRILSGRERRWYSMLVELGSSSVNFSTPSTMYLFTQLAHEAGPLLPVSEIDDKSALGIIHHVFQNSDFVQRLSKELKRRLDGIRENWRETSLMELLITLLLRVYNLAQHARQRSTAIALLYQARSTTLEWIYTLRQELSTVQYSNVSHPSSLYAFRAALLCRRTFMVFSEDKERKFDVNDLSCYIKASICLQQSLVVDVDSLQNLDKGMLKRDIQIIHALRDRVRDAIRTYPTAMTEAIFNGIGFMAGTSGYHHSTWKFYTDKNDGWVGSILSPQENNAKVIPLHVDFHITSGHMLVGRKTVGKLPDDIRDSPYVKELFEGQHLLTYPSSLGGMSHRLLTPIEYQMIHFGRRDGEITIVAEDRYGTIREYVPNRIFIDRQGIYDLPRGLVDGCIHWFNTTRGIVEIRRRQTMWKYRIKDWALDLQLRVASRNMVNLVDPHSSIAQSLRAIFKDFEDGQRLTIFQPYSGGSLNVELRHLELSFFINKGLLKCRELGLEIDPRQDIGTLYGYRSKIVLRDGKNWDNRSIIVPLGLLKWRPFEAHIDVWTAIDLSPRGHRLGMASMDKAYARFGIDTTIGCLTCPPEPRLLYTKAMLHAFTSYPVPDALTGRTGEEEATHTLLSGRCQPWSPLASKPCFDILRQIRQLAPERSFYPPDKRAVQKVTWDSFLPSCMQADRYARLADMILEKSEKLKCFQDNPDLQTQAGEEFAGHKRSLLAERGEIQRLRFECPQEDLDAKSPVANKDLDYVSLGCLHTMTMSKAIKGDSFERRSLATHKIVKMLCQKEKVIPIGSTVPDMMSNWPLIGGFEEASLLNSLPLSSFLDTKTIGEQWGRLVNLSIHEPPTVVMFTLGQLAFASHTDMDAICLLVAYANVPVLRLPEPPTHESFAGFKYKEAMSLDSLKRLISTAFVEYEASKITAVGRGAVQAEVQKKRLEHLVCCEKAATELAHLLIQQWPIHEKPRTKGFTSDLIDLSQARSAISSEWERLRNNHDLSLYVAKVQSLLEPYRGQPMQAPMTRYSKPDSNHHILVANTTCLPSLSKHLVCRDVQNFTGFSVSSTQKTSLREEAAVQWPQPSINTRYTPPAEYSELRQIISEFSGSEEPLRKAYGQDLFGSLSALEDIDRKNHSTGSATSVKLPTREEVSTRISIAKQNKSLIWSHLMASFSTYDLPTFLDGRPATHNWLLDVGLWPRFTTISILELLRSTSDHKFGKNMKEALVAYGCALTELQRLLRMERFLGKADDRRLLDEAQNLGHANWKPVDHPDWLLLEIEANILIRPEQIEVAQAIIEPTSKSNSVLQLNMGKGKTSCIVPMAIAVLASGKQLSRLIVPKALLLPTAQTVQSRLGGLIGRELRHIPFSRRLITGKKAEEVFALYKEHHEELLRDRGVFLAAPEHILAFKLCGFQCLADTRLGLASQMIMFQSEFINCHCRDVLDESDFTLAVRTQLVYPSGQLTAVDGAPLRWKIAQSILRLVEDNLEYLRRNFPRHIGALKRPGGGFPMVYILQADIEKELNRCIVNDICAGRVPVFQASSERSRSKGFNHSTHLLQQALSESANDKDVQRASELFSDPTSIANALILVRGLLQSGILLMCLRKRWNVQYGLHPKRWPIAVPFEAKGVPSERSEFGHPDVSILFTCLSFYYSGLDRSRFKDGLQHILHHADDPATEYEQWSAGSGDMPLPAKLRQWNAINVDDVDQVEELWVHLRFTRPVIDHYLNTFVFPVHCRQFSIKLQASAWDLPIYTAGMKPIDTSKKSKTSNRPKEPQAQTTGFSGTNDNKMMLPLTIKQNDLPSLRQTNAEVLTYLLQDRNRRYFCTGAVGRRWKEDELLRSLKLNDVHVFIDAGAYILERNNEDLAREWLRVESRAAAAVYFGETDNRAWVVYRDASGNKAPLVATPFVDKLDECVVYFDEAHTRGVDLQLPEKAIGALTLALGQTKDHTMQAAMRLRQLGSSQAIHFYAPPEVDQSIRAFCGQTNMPFTGSVESSHVIMWLLEQTCLANEQLRSLYRSHGYDFCRRIEAQWKYGKLTMDAHYRHMLLRVLEQPERQTVVQSYGTALSEMALRFKRPTQPRLAAFAIALDAQRKWMVSSQNARPVEANGAFEEVEQEREVEMQVEEVRQPQNRTKFKGLEFHGLLYKAIRRFVLTGILSGSAGYEQAFAYIAQTHIGARYGVHETTSRLFVSKEFGRTIVTPDSGRHPYDDFLRPVEWLLWSPATETGLVVIPEELELILPLFREKLSAVHLVAYASPVTRAMNAFGNLRFFAFPPWPVKYRLPSWLTVELGILGGRLYMPFEEVAVMQAYLQRAAEEVNNEGKQMAFCADIPGFLLEWLPLRRATQDILYTPAAYICQGRSLKESHAFFSDPGIVRGFPTVEGACGNTSGDDRGAEYEYGDLGCENKDVEDEDEDGDGNGTEDGEDTESSAVVCVSKSTR